jgi:hypothetical protein
VRHVPIAGYRARGPAQGLRWTTRFCSKTSTCITTTPYEICDFGSSGRFLRMSCNEEKAIKGNACADRITASGHQEATEDVHKQLDVAASKEPLHGSQLNSV